MPWIEKVGGDSLARSKLTVINFVKAMKNRTLLFDELCITIACRAFNVHAVILLDSGFWSTRPDNDSSNCLLKLAYVGDFGFKELCTETAMLFDDDESNESGEEEEEEGMTDLEDTGLFGSEHDSGVSSEKDANEDDVDVKPDINTLLPFSTTFTTTAEHPIVLSDDESNVDVKPDVNTLLPFSTTFTTTAEHPIVLSDDESNVDVKPDLEKLARFTTTFTTSAENPIDLVSDDDDATHQNASKPKVQRVKRERIYSCYICMETFQMQSSFVKHHYELHSESSFKCEFCDSYFESENGLFKHERSHLYMNHICKDCGKFFQFPYQLRAHATQHTGLGKHQCSICTKEFGCKTSKDFHEKNSQLPGQM